MAKPSPIESPTLVEKKGSNILFEMDSLTTIFNEKVYLFLIIESIKTESHSPNNIQC